MTVPVYTANDTLALLPAIVLVLFGCGILAIDILGGKVERNARWLSVFGLVGLLLAGLSVLRQITALERGGLSAFVAGQNSLILDGPGFLLNAAILGTTVLFYLISYRYLEVNGEHRAEYYALALLAEGGMYFMVTAADLVTLYLGLELTSLCFYILVGFTRLDRRSNEAAVKYLLLGAVAAGFVLYGFSLLYGIAGDTSLQAVSTAVAHRQPNDPFVVLAVVTATAGILFKVSGVPFHTWAPDAYEGAPTPVTAYLSVASKIAGFGALLRLLPFTLGAARNIWEPLLVFAAVASMTVGTIAALTQERLKRLLAYSSIAHAGYVLLGIIAGNETGLKGVYIYLVVYAVMNMGAFAVLIALNRRGAPGDRIEDLRGLSKSYPVHAALFVVLLVSLAGLPPTAGFIAKYYIFFALIQTGHYVVAAIASVYVVVSLYFYFRLVREMYLAEGEERRVLASNFGTQVALYATAGLSLLLGLYPEPLLRIGFQLAGGGR